MAGPSLLERAIRHDRAVVVTAVAAITLLSWRYLTREAAAMDAMAADQAMHAAMGMPAMATWGGAELLALFLMWSVMMIAMMLPSATPLLFLVAGTYRRRDSRATVGGSGDSRTRHASLLTLIFAAGYLITWTAFSALAALSQIGLHRAALLSPEMRTTSAMAGGLVLVAAGVYQWLPIKGACLTHCRSPLSFLSHEWREGAGGALVMGARHGLYCVGCCWALMLLLFVAGVMNLAWIAGLALFVLIEKLAPRGVQFGRIAGILLVAWGVWVMASS
jgi:predicted metal-binding membrane protein